MAAALSDAAHVAAGPWVLRDNAVARRFYERLGGTIVGETCEALPDATPVEVAYGWTDLSRLHAGPQARPRRAASVAGRARCIRVAHRAMSGAMWLAVSLPTLDHDQAIGRLVGLHAAIGARLEPGDALADVTIDLSAGIARDCPPVSTCRIILREAAWLREVRIAPGHRASAGAVLALLSTDAASPPEAPARQARTTVAGIVHHEDWWAAPE